MSNFPQVGAFLTREWARFRLTKTYLATTDIAKKWTAPLRNWPLILNQLAIRFEDRWPQ